MQNDLISRSELREQMERAFMLESMHGRSDTMLSVVNNVIATAPPVSHSEENEKRTLGTICPRCGARLILEG